MTQIKIVTFNIPFFPSEVKDVGELSNKEVGLKGKDRRAQGLVEKIRNMADNQPDAITLQEVWDNKFKRKIRNGDLGSINFRIQAEVFEWY